MRKTIIALVTLAALGGLFFYLLTHMEKKIECRAEFSYGEDGRYILIDPPGTVLIKEIRLKDSTFRIYERADVYKLYYRWSPETKVSLKVYTDRGVCTISKKTPSVRESLTFETVESIPEHIFVRVNSAGYRVSILTFQTPLKVVLYRGPSVFTDEGDLYRVYTLLKRQLREAGFEVEESTEVSGDIAVIAGGVIPQNLSTETKIIYLGKTPPGKYIANPSGGIDKGEPIVKFVESTSDYQLPEGRVKSLYYPAGITEWLKRREDGQPGVFAYRNFVIYTSGIDDFPSPEVCAREVLRTILKGRLVEFEDDNYINAKVVLPAEPSNYTAVALGWKGSFISTSKKLTVTVPERKGDVEVRRVSGREARVSVFSEDKTALWLVNYYNGYRGKDVFNLSSPVATITISLHDGGNLLVLYNSKGEALAAQHVHVPHYRVVLEDNVPILYRDGQPYSGEVTLLTKRGERKVYVNAGRLPKAESVVVDGFNIPIPRSHYSVTPEHILILIVFLFMVFSKLKKEEKDDELIIVFRRPVGPGEEESVEISAEEVVHSMERFSEAVGRKWVPLNADEVRMALIRYAPNVTFHPSLKEVRSLMDAMAAAGYVVAQDGYYAPERWCRDQSMLHLVMCRAIYEKLVERGVAARITTKMRVEEVQREVRATGNGIEVVERTVKKRAKVPDVVGVKGHRFFLVECETGKNRNPNKIKAFIKKAQAFPENFVFILVITPEAQKILDAAIEEIGPVLRELEEQDRFQLYYYRDGKIF